MEHLEIKILPVQSYFVMVVINSGKGKRTCSQTQKENNTRHKVRCFGLYQGICSMYFPAVFFFFFFRGLLFGQGERTEASVSETSPSTVQLQLQPKYLQLQLPEDNDNGCGAQTVE